MRLRTPARSAAAATAAVCVSALLAAGTPSATAAQDPSKQSRKFRDAVTAEGIGQHLDALQAIATANGGSRASGTPGYQASRDYVVQRLRDAGYKPTVQTFQFPFFVENAPAQLDRVSPTPKPYANPDDFATMSFSGSGDVTAEVVAVDTDLSPNAGSTSGCEAADFAGFPAGAIALIQRGTCTFGTKADNAVAAGAAAVVVFNRGTEPDTGTVNGTLGHVVDVPVLGASFAVGQELGAPDTTAHVFTDTTNETRTTYNVLAETARGNSGNVVMAGAHLDSVEDGAGINDNGSGSATILEIAEELAKQKRLTNQVRFAWWGAEEFGLLGSRHYVNDLKSNNPGALTDIAAYLNFDMVGSPNFVRFVYDGDNSTGGASGPGPEGSSQIETLFTQYFERQHLASEPTPFNGRSDYGPFIENGIAAGGLFTGAEGVKTPEQAKVYGGTAGQAYDPCYHSACDTRANISVQAIDQMSDAAAHVVYTLARSTASIEQTAAAKTSGAKGQKIAKAKAESKGHRLVR